MDIILDDIRSANQMPLKSTTLVAFTNDGFKKVTTKNLVELNSQGKIPIQYLNFTDLILMGVYDASTNSPILTDSVGQDSQYYIVNVSGSQNLGSGVLNMTENDRLIYSNGKWNLVPTEEELLYNNDFDI